MSHSTIVAFLLIAASLASGHDDTSQGMNGTVDFLQRYGYLDTVTDHALITNAELRHAIFMFQEYYHIPVDGTLNNATLNLMSRQRCGVTDTPSHRMLGTAPLRWNKLHLKWNFHLANGDMLRLAEKAFDIWAMNSSLTFTRDIDKPDIVIAFRDGKHIMSDRRYNGKMCPDDLDGPGSVLAHAMLPTGTPDYVSEVHIDQREAWYYALNANPVNTHHLLRTLLHEIGHTLGLQHTPNENSVMYAYEPNVQWPVSLALEDILTLQNLYPAEATTVSKPTFRPTMTTTTTTTARTTRTTTTRTTMRMMTTMMTTPTTRASDRIPTEPPPSPCNWKNVDCILVLRDHLFATQGPYAWSIGLDGNISERPFLLRDYMRFLPKNFTHLSAVYETSQGHLVLFVDDLVYMVSYPNLELQKSWPRYTTSLGLPPNARVNAAITDHKGRTYIIYNDYIVVEIDNCQMSANLYGTIHDTFPGIPTNIRTAFRYIDGQLYFLHKDRFFAYNDFTQLVTRSGEFDLDVIGVTCPKENILRKLWDLLARLSRLSGVYA